MNDISILCVDDDKSIRFALTAIIESQNWTAYSSKNVEEGLKIFKEKNPTLVLMDYRMPGENGMIGVEKIRNLNSEVPIIVFTIDEDRSVAKKFMDLGATDFAVKPIKAPDLISRINLHLKLLENKNADTKSESNILKNISLPKGIGESTLILMIEKLKNKNEFLTVEKISSLTGISDQTAYRYLQFMQEENLIEVKSSYGKIGRPKQEFKLPEKSKN